MSTPETSKSCFCDRPIDRSTDRTVITTIEDGLATITINRAEACNALTPEIIQTINESIELFGIAEDVRAIAIYGRGGSFSAGCDVVSLYTMGEREIAAFMDLGRSCTEAIEECPKLVISAVDGCCLGGGFEIMLACDLVLATNNAFFGFPEVKFGLIPGFGGTQRATNRLGAARAKELIMTGRRIDAQTALSWGLINLMVSDGGLQGEIKDLAHNLCKHSPRAIAAAKRSINSGVQGGFTAGMAAERENFLECFADPFTKSNMAAFSECTSKIK